MHGNMARLTKNYEKRYYLRTLLATGANWP